MDALKFLLNFLQRYSFELLIDKTFIIFSKHFYLLVIYIYFILVQMTIGALE